jgi:hypothetical protein
MLGEGKRARRLGAGRHKRASRRKAPGDCRMTASQPPLCGRRRQTAQVMMHDAAVAKSVAREIDLVMSFKHPNIVQVGTHTRACVCDPPAARMQSRDARSCFDADVMRPAPPASAVVIGRTSSQPPAPPAVARPRPQGRAEGSCRRRRSATHTRIPHRPAPRSLPRRTILWLGGSTAPAPAQEACWCAQRQAPARPSPPKQKKTCPAPRPCLCHALDTDYMHCLGSFEPWALRARGGGQSCRSGSRSI